MNPEDDLSKLLPDAPPHPDRRETAITEAMRRFDGEKPAAPSAQRRPQWVRPSWLSVGGVQMRALMSMGVLAVVGVPLALMVAREQTPVTPQGEPASAINPGNAAHPQTPADISAGRAVRQEPAASPVAGKEADRAVGLVVRDEPAASPAAPAPTATPAPPPPPALAQTSAGSVAAASESENKQGIVVTGSRIARRDYTATSPTVTVDTEPLAKTSRLRAEDDDSAAVAIVITGSRISASAAKAARRGDWNICTVNDPARSLERCRRQTEQNAKGDMGRAAERMGDGLSRAWDGDLRGAIAAFDAAIEIRPKYAFAYLNRGMAYARLSESELAIKDFDQAINYAPYDARAYYQRSVALRALRKDARAVTDAERAVSLDRQYEDLFD
jgi:hypothetical protein